MQSSAYRVTREILSSPLSSSRHSQEEILSSENEGEERIGRRQTPVKKDCTEIGVDGRYMKADQEGSPLIPAMADNRIRADSSAPSLPRGVLSRKKPSPEPTNHDNDAPPEMPYSCSECGRGFTDPVTLLRHEKAHRERLRFTCNLCGKGCISKSDLIKHERVHTGEKPYACSLCGKCYSQKSHLYTHERIHTGEKPFSCTECLRRFSFKSQLLRHLKDHSDPQSAPARHKNQIKPMKPKLPKPPIAPPAKTYSCTLCGKSFLLKTQLISHILNDTGDGPDSCSNRRRTVSISLNPRLTRPRKVYSEEDTYACEECGKCFILKSQLIKHVRLHAAVDQNSAVGLSVSETIVKVERDPSGENPFSCAECGESFSHKNQLIKHVREHAREELNSSTDQEGGLSIVETIVKIENDSLEESPFSCAECGKCFSLKSQLIKHVREHAGEEPNSGQVPAAKTNAKDPRFNRKPYSCEECGKCFRLKTQVIKHKRDHKRGRAPANVPYSRKKVWTVNGKVFRPVKGAGEKPYTCDECGKGFLSVPDLARHMRMHIRGKPFNCSFCGKGCASKSDLIKHERVHTGEKPYPCSYCGQRFSQTSHLNQHERIHTGVKPYSCSQCGKSYAFKSQLTKHEQIHTEGKIYPCSKCTKIFSVEEERDQHERVHTEEKPYSCSVCGKCFHWKAAFVRHERAHKGKLPFTCAECGRGCGSRYDLIKHERVHTREKPYACTDCGKCYTQKSHLNMHVKVHAV